MIRIFKQKAFYLSNCYDIGRLMQECPGLWYSRFLLENAIERVMYSIVRRQIKTINLKLLYTKYIFQGTL